MHRPPTGPNHDRKFSGSGFRSISSAGATESPSPASSLFGPQPSDGAGPSESQAYLTFVTARTALEAVETHPPQGRSSPDPDGAKPLCPIQSLVANSSLRGSRARTSHWQLDGCPCLRSCRPRGRLRVPCRVGQVVGLLRDGFGNGAMIGTGGK